MLRKYSYINRAKLSDGISYIYSLYDGVANKILTEADIIYGLSSGNMEIDGIQLINNSIVLQDKTGIVLDNQISIRTGQNLKNYVDTSLIGKPNQRNFVKQIVKYCIEYKNDRNVYGISGLRGMGKTTGMLQAIRDLNDYESSMYITLFKKDKEEISFSKLMQLFKGDYYIKYLFIDEITLCSDFTSCSAFLHDYISMSGTRVIIAGTDSLALNKAAYTGLCHRMLLRNITFMSYKETIDTIGPLKYSEYLELGGIYKSQPITNTLELREYVDTSVVSNILNTLSRNADVKTPTGLEYFIDNPVQLKTVVFIILYAIIYSTTEHKIKLNLGIVNYLFTSDLYVPEEIKNSITEELGLSMTEEFSESSIAAVLKSLVDIGIVNKVSNIGDSNSYNYYITNQCIFNQLLVTIIDSKSEYVQLRERASIRRKQGYLFESSIVNHTIEALKNTRYNVAYYHDAMHREVDMVIEADDYQDVFTEHKYLLFEVKLTDNIDLAIAKSRWINCDDLYLDGEVVDRYIIYSGHSCTFESFKDRDIKTKVPLDELERMNKGVKLLSVKDYLFNIEKYASMLE